ncbi:MAG: squalene/phytoene synthase family protein [Betaproteobacteria bacterium]|nr:squalene/phytoene synthase family protein [Betaproteobacteria bacterium]
MSVQHYENFPVASVLCPPALRPAIAAIYHFARTADDLADEGDATSDQRLNDLAAFRSDLVAVCDNKAASTRWADMFVALSRQIQAFQLPTQLLHDLVTAFEQDVRYTAQAHRYADEAELLDYCRLSANPVKLIAAQVLWASQKMQKGASLARRIPGRAGWELRLVVQGGLRILHKLEANGFDALQRRPKITGWDAGPVLWGALRMS